MFSQRQKDILVGLLLGDGSLEFDKCKASRLQVKQAEEKKEYVLWLYQCFSEVVKTSPKQRMDTKQWYFGTRYTKEFEKFRKLFYLGRKRILPSIINDLILSSLTIAIWYMDDGRLDYRAKSHYAYIISTDSFSVAEVQKLQSILLKKFFVPSTMHMSLCRGKRYPKIYIGKDGRDNFLKIILPHILECFYYKIPPFARKITLTPQRLHAEPQSILRLGDDIVRSSQRCE